MLSRFSKLFRLRHSNQSQLHFSRAFTSKLFIKELAFSTTEDDLSKAFSKFGGVTEAKIMYNEVGKSKGYGYVTFNTSKEAENALEEMNGKLLDGRYLYVDRARPNQYKDYQTPIARGPPIPESSSLSERESSSSPKANSPGLPQQKQLIVKKAVRKASNLSKPKSLSDTEPGSLLAPELKTLIQPEPLSLSRVESSSLPRLNSSRALNRKSAKVAKPGSKSSIEPESLSASEAESSSLPTADPSTLQRRKSWTAPKRKTSNAPKPD